MQTAIPSQARVLSQSGFDATKERWGARIGVGARILPAIELASGAAAMF
jgi:hypothetical protein